MLRLHYIVDKFLQDDFIVLFTNNNHLFKDKRNFVDNLVGDNDNGMIITKFYL
jgi:hypothetical protein